jgi:2-hydroxychromene-2-carboxylate isomerase
MSLLAGLDAARLSVLLDLRHPLAYLALHPAMSFGESHGLAINWLPLSVPALKPPTAPAADDDRGVRHRRFRAKALEREIETYAAAQGLVLRGTHRDAPVLAANLAWIWMRDRHADRLQNFLSELFRSYWSLDLDAESLKALASLLDSLGAEGARYLEWAGDAGPAAAASLDAELRGFGLFQVPAYVVDGEVFYGRQHLPMIEWILNSRSGPAPI